MTCSKPWGWHISVSPNLLLYPLPTGPVPAGQTPGDPGPRLSQLSVTDMTTSSLRLNWEAPLGSFDTFLIRFGVPSPSTLEPHLRPLLQRELMVPGTQRSAVLRDLHPGTLYSLTLYGLRGPHKADSIQGTARTLSPGEDPRWAPKRGHWTLQSSTQQVTGVWRVARGLEGIREILLSWEPSIKAWRTSLKPEHSGRRGRNLLTHALLTAPLPCCLQFWRAPVTYNSVKLGKHQPESTGCRHHPGWTVSKSPTSSPMEVMIPSCQVLLSSPLLPAPTPAHRPFSSWSQTSWVTPGLHPCL